LTEGYSAVDVDRQEARTYERTLLTLSAEHDPPVIDRKGRGQPRMRRIGGITETVASAALALGSRTRAGAPRD
jgi:hypothetical protein